MVRYVMLHGPSDAAFFTQPFYDPATFQFPRVSTGISIAALTYIGFDSISTLSEEAIDPHRDIMRATVLTCLLTGVLAALECYAGQLVWPDFAHYPNVDTAYVFVAGRAGGHSLFTLVNATLLIATIGSGTGAMMGCARLLYGMSGGGALPRAFSYVEPRRGVPSRNVLFCGAIALLGAWSISYQLGCELLNFGAFLAFLGVNASAFHHDYVRGGDRRFLRLLVPVIGGLVCLYIWWSLRWQAKAAGFAWVAVGALYFAFRRQRSLVTHTA
jgi:amino acid transporter